MATEFKAQQIVISIDSTTENPVEMWLYMYEEIVELVGQGDNRDKTHVFELLKHMRPAYETAKKMVV